MKDRGKLSPTVENDLSRLKTKGIPVDIILEQGVDVLGLGRPQ